MKKVKALQTVHGNYGTMAADETFEVSDSDAKELEEKGLVKVVASAGADPKEETTKTSVNITEAPKTKEKVSLNLKGEKKSNAGPNAPKKAKK